MKKITFILVALISGTAFAQDATGTADVNAEIVSPITITEVGSALNFGSINAHPDGGTVTITPAGDRSFVNDDLAIVTATAITAASFEINAADEYAYTITIDDTELSGAGDAMAVTFTHQLDGGYETDPVGKGANQTLTVGGTLTVGQSQAPGAYEGTVTVIVAYE